MLRRTPEQKRRDGEWADKYIAKDGGPPQPTPEGVLKGLTEMGPVEYGRRREALAKKLEVPLKFLDDEYRMRRKTPTSGEAIFTSRAPEPWREPVEGAALLDELVKASKRFMSMPSGGAEIVALWVLHTYAWDCFDVTPRLAITSPAPECGKTTLLNFLHEVVRDPLSASNMTAAVAFRAVETMRPTLLIDEADTSLGDNRELRGILNSGHHRNGSVLRTEGDNHDLRQFSTWSPLAIAMIGKLHPTLASRSLHVELQRKAASETLMPFRSRDVGSLVHLKQKAARWVKDNRAALVEGDPEMPEIVLNRAADNWLPLFAIADLARGHWPHTAREIAKASATDTSATFPIMLLVDLQMVFERRGDKIHSDDLVADLWEMEDRPWAEYGPYGKPISKNQVASLLSNFHVAPKQVWCGGLNRRGYTRDMLEGAFSRYLNARALEPVADKDLRGTQIARPKNDLAAEEARNPLKSKGSSGLAFFEGETRRDAHTDFPELPACLDRQR
jgi:hypothetical protein